MRAYPVLFEDLDGPVESYINFVNGDDDANTYNTDAWFKFLTYFNNGVYNSGRILRILMSLYGSREVIIPHKIMKVDYDSESQYLRAVATYIGNQIESLFILNQFKYQKVFDVLMEEYHPLWNVEGSETRTITETQEGYRQNQKITTGGYEDATVIDYEGTETITKGGSDSTVKSGYVENTKSGYQEDTKSGSETHSTIPMENSTFYDTDKTTYNNVKDKLEYTNLKDKEEYSDLTDETTYGMTDTKSFNNREDTNTKTVTYNNLTDTTKDSVSEDFEHKTVDEFERGMNLGIMATQDLVKNEVQLRMEADFRTMVYRDIANYVFYMS